MPISKPTPGDAIGNVRSEIRRRIPAGKPFFTADANISWAPELSGWLTDTTVSLNVQNLLDKDPPLFLASPGFDAARSNPLGRLVTLSVGKRF